MGQCLAARRVAEGAGGVGDWASGLVGVLNDTPVRGVGGRERLWALMEEEHGVRRKDPASWPVKCPMAKIYGPDDGEVRPWGDVSGHGGPVDFEFGGSVQRPDPCCVMLLCKTALEPGADPAL
jgi:hypothetical protein